MLPSGKFPRIAIAVALLVAALLLFDLLAVRDPAKSLLISNSLDLFIIFWAALCSLFVARRSSGYPRQLWLLLGIAFLIESAAQAVSSYYQSFVPGAYQIPWPSDVLFFLWVAPVVMMLLPRSGNQAPGIDSLRILDFTQITIVAATAYLYFFNIPSRWQAHSASLIRQILILYIVRDLFLALAFFSRSRASRSLWLRKFSLGLALFFLFAAVSNGDYLLTLNSFLGGATWGDLLWFLPYLVIVFLAALWRPDRVTHSAAPPSRFGDFVVTHALPVGIPLLVIFMGRRIAKEQFLIAWLAVTVSFVCSALRLILTNRKQRQTSDALLNIQEALRRSERMFSSAFRSSPDSMSINVFPDGPYVDVNDGFTRLTGYSREEALGKTPADLHLWENPARRGEFFSEFARTGELQECEFRFRTKSGQLRIGHMSGALLDLDAKRCCLVVVRDITARKAADELLRSNEQRFRSLVEHIHVGIASFDPQARMQFANQAALDMFGLKLEEIIGKTTKELGLQPFLEDGTPLPDSARPTAVVIATDRPVRSHVLAWRLPHTDEILWTLLDAIPEFDAAQNLTRILASLTNITEQRKALDALRESEERFRSLVENLHVGIIIYDPQVRVLFANQAVQDAFGRQYEQFLGKTTNELGLFTLREDGTELPAEARPVPLVLATKQPVRSQVIGVGRRDSPVVTWALLDAIPEFNAAGEISRVIVSVTDLTEQREALEALRESEERFRTLVRDLHVAVILSDPNGKFEFVNQAALKILGPTESEIIGRDVGSLGLTPLDEQGRVIRDDERPVPTVLRTKRPVYSRTMGWRRSGSPEIFWIFGNSVPQFNPDGSILRVISSFTDITEMKNAEQAIRKLSMQLLNLQDEERRRIGRELHDGMAQTVLAVNLSLAQVRQSSPHLSAPAGRALEKARTLLQQMSREIRTLSYLLHPPLLDELGLVSALKEYVRGFSERSGIETELVLPNHFSRLPQSVEIALFRVVQESLANIQRHSGSDSAAIRLLETPTSLTLEIIDYGRGFNLPSDGHSQPNAAHLGVGIPGMRERLAQLGGRLEIDSSSSGTTIRATIFDPEALYKEALDGSPSHPDRG